MASLAATHLGRLGVDKIIVANRTRERADNLVDHARQAGVRAEAVDFADRYSTYGEVDIIVSATGADNYTVERASFPEIRRDHVVLIDLSLPRDIADDTADLPGVDLVNIERLHQSLTSQSEEDTPSGLCVRSSSLLPQSSACVKWCRQFRLCVNTPREWLNVKWRGCGNVAQTCLTMTSRKCRSRLSAPSTSCCTSPQCERKSWLRNPALSATKLRYKRCLVWKSTVALFRWMQMSCRRCRK